MEKYGVQLDPEGVKTSEDLMVTQKCGSCGSTLEPTANVPKCPRCGTKPFESPGPRKS